MNILNEATELDRAFYQGFAMSILVSEAPEGDYEEDAIWEMSEAAWAMCEGLSWRD